MLSQGQNGYLVQDHLQPLHWKKHSKPNGHKRLNKAFVRPCPIPELVPATNVA